ncbi:MAG TPA: YtxH domain-containing protein [Gemmatimonadales bacterium]|nr:YtxH domain-containing protein [Gemmatimonadales bacterium]
MFDRDESSSGSGFAMGLVLGALIGAVAALAYAPERGDVMRRKVGRKLRRAGDTAREVLEDTADEVRGEIARRRRDVARNLGV